MDTFTFTKQNLVFPNDNPEHKFHIQDDLLYDCIGLGRGCSNDPNRVTGFNVGKQFGYALLTYFTTRALNIQRFPFCEDRIYTNFYGQNKSHMNIISQLNEKRIESICCEVRNLYQHTQLQLRKKSLHTVSIGRKIRESGDNYVKGIIAFKRAAELLNSDSVWVEMDTLNSFGDEGAYWGEVFLKMDIPASDIFYCSRLIADRPEKSYAVESGEWVVLNRSPTGVTELPLSAIQVDDDMWRKDQQLTTDSAKKIIEQYNPFVFRNLHRSEPNYGSHGLTHSLKGKILSRLFNYLNK